MSHGDRDVDLLCGLLFGEEDLQKGAAILVEIVSKEGSAAESFLLSIINNEAMRPDRDSRWVARLALCAIELAKQKAAVSLN